MAAAGDGGLVDSLLSSDSGGSAAGYGSGLIGGILDAAIGPVMANVNYIRSKSPTNRQTGYAKFMAENAPSWAMDGMRKAGLNPILAFGRGPVGGGETPGMVNARGEARSDISGALARGVSSAKQASLMSENLKLIREQVREQTNKADASGLLTAKTHAEIGEILARQGLLDQEMQTAPFARQRMQMDSARIAADTKFLGTRDRAALMGIPYSDEQIEAVGKTPIGSLGRAIKKMISGGAEAGSRAFRGFRRPDFRFEFGDQGRVEDEKYGDE